MFFSVEEIRNSAEILVLSMLVKDFTKKYVFSWLMIHSKALRTVGKTDKKPRKENHTTKDVKKDYAFSEKSNNF